MKNTPFSEEEVWSTPVEKHETAWCIVGVVVFAVVVVTLVVIL